MDNLTYILFICIVAPLLILLLMTRGRSRTLLGYLMIGIFIALFSSELNSVLAQWLQTDSFYMTTVVTPIAEEITKALPVVFYALVFSDKQDKVIPVAFAVGVGFAMFENTVILVQNIDNVTIGWAIVRGFITALMHAVCTAAIGYGICFIKKEKALCICGSFAMLSLSCIYHGIFNMLIQSDYKVLAVILPLVTYVPLVILQCKYYKMKRLNMEAEQVVTKETIEEVIEEA